MWDVEVREVVLGQAFEPGLVAVRPVSGPRPRLSPVRQRLGAGDELLDAVDLGRCRGDVGGELPGRCRLQLAALTADHQDAEAPDGEDQGTEAHAGEEHGAHGPTLPPCSGSTPARAATGWPPRSPVTKCSMTSQASAMSFSVSGSRLW